MPTTPNGLPYPGNPASEPPNGPLQIGNLALAADSKLVGRFTTTAARDAAITTPVRGQIAMVGSTMFVHTGTGWVPPGASMRAQRNTNTPGFPHNEWTGFGSPTNWNHTDAWGMHGSGATVVHLWTGWYQVNATLWFNNDGTGARGIALMPSAGVDIGEGAAQRVYLDMRGATAGGSDSILSGSLLYSVNAGATVTLEGWQNSGAPLQVNSVRISATYIGPV